MARIQCPCCGYYTHDSDQYLFEICEVCLWQYDEISHDNPGKKGGANSISLNEAKENYKKFHICKIYHIGKGLTREPLLEELPANNTSEISMTHGSTAKH